MAKVITQLYDAAGVSVEVRFNPQSRRLRLWSDTAGQVKLSVPPRTPKALIERMLTTQQAWILEHSAPVENLQFDEKALRKRASQLLPQQLAAHAKLHQLQYQRIQLRAQRSRWGSCSTSGTISLSIYLVLLPEHLRTYVILHELAHTIEHNHQAGFWRLLDRLCGGEGQAKKLDAELKKIRITDLISQYVSEAIA